MDKPTKEHEKHGSVRRKLKVKGMAEMHEIIGYIENILESIKKGKVVFESGSDHIEFTPREVAEVEFEAVQKSDKRGFSFELTWRDKPKAGEKFDLKISSVEAGIPVDKSETIASKSAFMDEPFEFAPEYLEFKRQYHPGQRKAAYEQAKQELKHYGGTEAFCSEYIEEYAPTHG